MNSKKTNAKKPPMPTAALLVGGLGTRLRPLTNHVPKPMVKINGKPFLHYLLSMLAATGVKRCMLLTGYRHDKVKSYCGDGSKWGLKISYSREHQPLGTGGALLFASRKTKGQLLVMNGDSFMDLDLPSLLKFHRSKKSLATVHAMKGSLKDRGEIKLGSAGRIVAFKEKGSRGKGVFNTGAYLFSPQALLLLKKSLGAKRSFSMERVGMPLLAATGRLHAYVGHGRFLDMGTHSQLKAASRVLR